MDKKNRTIIPKKADVSPKVEGFEKDIERRKLLGLSNEQEDFDKILDKNNEIKWLHRGKLIYENDLKSFFKSEPKDYPPPFTKESQFYSELSKKIPELGPLDRFTKPWEVGRLTKMLVYGQFGIELVSLLEKENPYVSKGLRANWHYKYLNEEGYFKLVEFIKNVVDELKAAKTYHEFRLKMVEKYKIPYQLPITFPNYNC